MLISEKLENKRYFMKASTYAKEDGVNVVSIQHLMLSCLINDEKFYKVIKSSIIGFDDFMNELKKEAKKSTLENGEKVASKEVCKIIESLDSKILNENIFSLIINSKTIKRKIEDRRGDTSKISFKINGIGDKKENMDIEKNAEKIKKIELDDLKTPQLNIFESFINKIKNEDDGSEFEGALINLKKQNKKENFKCISGREKETQQIIEILNGRNKSSLILIGEAGVGKTALIKDLALRMALGEFSESINKRLILELNIADIMSGTRYQGSLEEKINKIIKKIEEDDLEVILVIENIQSIMDKKEKSDSSSSLKNLLKPMIDSGKLKCIGTTTKQGLISIKGDQSFERMFKLVYVEEPTEKETILMLRLLKPDLEKFHGLKIEDDAILESVRLASRYITTKSFPDKAIDLIDSACAMVKVSINSKPIEIKNIENEIKLKRNEKKAIFLSEKPDVENEEKLNSEITFLIDKLNELNKIFEREKKQEENKHNVIDGLVKETINEVSYILLKTKVSKVDVLTVISKETGLPLDKINKDDNQKMIELESKLSKKVIGQSNAIKLVANAIKRSHTGMSDPERPKASFLFLGSTGVGKTELCKCLSNELFENDKSLLRLDMSEFMDKSSLNQLIGSPVGYEGSSEGGKLTEFVKNKPYSILLFDEIEKAHPELLNILLQILDEGRLTDAKGVTVNFKNTIIVMTSNIGAEHIKENMATRHKDRVIKALEKVLKPELINRIDEQIIFKKISKVDIYEICKISLSKVKDRLLEKNIKIEFSKETIEYISSVSHDSKYGARPLNKKIKIMVEDEISNKILDGSLVSGDNVIFNLNKKSLTIKDVK